MTKYLQVNAVHQSHLHPSVNFPVQPQLVAILNTCLSTRYNM